MRGPATSGVRAEPNVTPMIDVMLVLLIIFMAIGPLLDAGFTATPPEARTASAHPDETTDAVIGLDAQGRLFFNKQPIDTTRLRATLLARFTARPDDRLVYLRADESLTYETVQGAMELASGAGARVVGLVSTHSAPAPNVRAR